MVDALGALPEIEDAFPVLGRPVVVARVDAPKLEGLAELVSRVSQIEGMVVSETLLEIPEEAVT